MGYDLTMTVQVVEEVEVELGGMTYNINRLLARTRWAGLKLSDLNGFTARDAAIVLGDVLKDWTADPDHFREVEVSDWGSLDACTQWLLDILIKLKKYPDATLEVSA